VLFVVPNIFRTQGIRQKSRIVSVGQQNTHIHIPMIAFIYLVCWGGVLTINKSNRFGGGKFLGLDGRTIGEDLIVLLLLATVEKVVFFVLVYLLMDVGDGLQGWV